jgi:hypothetical protein
LVALVAWVALALVVPTFFRRVCQKRVGHMIYRCVYVIKPI